MSSIQILTPDHEFVFQQLQLMGEMAPVKLDMVLQRLCAILEGGIKNLIMSETHGTGLTASSIETRKEGELEYGVGSYTRGNILRFLDAGTGIYRSGKAIFITPVAARALRFISKETGDLVFAKYCIVLGIIPHNFLIRAVYSSINELDAILKEEMEKT